MIDDITTITTGWTAVGQETACVLELDWKMLLVYPDIFNDGE